MPISARIVGGQTAPPQKQESQPPQRRSISACAEALPRQAKTGRLEPPPPSRISVAHGASPARGACGGAFGWKPPPITPPALFPPRGERGSEEPTAHRSGGDGGRPTGKFGFRPFPPIITGGQAPIFPDLKALWISDGGKIALRRWGVDFARSRSRRNGRKQKTT